MIASLVAGLAPRCSKSSLPRQSHPGVAFMRKDQIARFALESPRDRARRDLILRDGKPARLSS